MMQAATIDKNKGFNACFVSPIFPDYSKKRKTRLVSPILLVDYFVALNELKESHAMIPTPRNRL